MLSVSSLDSLLIDLESGRQQLLKLVNTSLVSRMSRQVSTYIATSQQRLA
jgi:hypothetical protein